MASNIVITQINGEDITKGFNPVLVSSTVSGAAVTSIDFSGLDINLHGGSYEIELRLNNATASAATISAYINNDTTATNYYSERDSAAASTPSGANANTAVIANMLGSDTSDMYKLDVAIVNSYAHVKSKGTYGATTAIVNDDYSMKKTATVANITQITFVSSVASSIGIGSQIIIRRKDK